ncbi:chromosome segregation protein [European chub iridovirus]|nr:chromosome segregation protein [European chub iridovirus]
MQRPHVYSVNNHVVQWLKNGFLDSVDCPVYQNKDVNISTYVFQPYTEERNNPYSDGWNKYNQVYTLNNDNVTGTNSCSNDVHLGRPPVSVLDIRKNTNDDKLFSFPNPVDLTEKNVDLSCLDNKQTNNRELLQYVHQYVSLINDVVQRNEHKLKHFIEKQLRETTLVDYVNERDVLSEDEKTLRMRVIQDNLDKYKQTITEYINKYKTYLDDIYQGYVTDMPTNETRLTRAVQEEHVKVDDRQRKIKNQLLQYISETKHIYDVKQLNQLMQLMKDFVNNKIQEGCGSYMTANSVDFDIITRRLDLIDKEYRHICKELQNAAQLTATEVTELETERVIYKNVRNEFERLQQENQCISTEVEIKKHIQEHLHESLRTHTIDMIINTNTEQKQNPVANNIDYIHYTTMFPVKSGNRYLLDLNLYYYYRFYRTDNTTAGNLFRSINVYILLNDTTILTSHTSNLLKQFPVKMFYLWNNITVDGNAKISVKVELRCHEKQETFRLVTAFPNFGNYFSIVKL